LELDVSFDLRKKRDRTSHKQRGAFMRVGPSSTDLITKLELTSGFSRTTFDIGSNLTHAFSNASLLLRHAAIGHGQVSSCW
jgi:hypothetical protein